MAEPDPRTHDLFAPLDEDAWAEVKAASRATRHEADEVMFRQGDPAARFFFVLDGAVKLVRRGSDGQEKVIEVIQTGQTFAEAAMFMGFSYPVDAICLRPTAVVGFDSAHFRALLRRSPDACLALLARLARRAHAHLAEVDALALRSATERVIGFVLQQAGDRPGFHLAYPKQVLASRLGMTPESLSRALAALRGRGLIAVHGSYVQVLDRRGLEARLEP